MDTREQYARCQRAFWNVSDLRAARFQRVDLVSGGDEQQWAQLAQRDLDVVLRGLSIETQGTILEVGCGVGRLIPLLLRRLDPHKVIGVDISQQMIQFARTALADDPRVELHVNSGYDLSMLRSNCVDFAYANDVFIHIADGDTLLAYLQDIQRVLKKGAPFRFNVRAKNLDASFSNSFGGRLAKFAYRSGLRSTVGRWKSGGPVGFNGIEFLLRDLRRLISAGRLSAEDIEYVHLDEGRFWCTTRKRNVY